MYTQDEIIEICDNALFASFIFFLKEHNLYKDFRQNFDADYNPNTIISMISHGMAQAVNDSFTWRETPEGFHHWEVANMLWTKVCHDIICDWFSTLKKYKSNELYFLDDLSHFINRMHISNSFKSIFINNARKK